MCIMLMSYVFWCVIFMLGDKQEAKFRVVMSVQNSHDIPPFYYVFVPFLIVISVVISLYMIFGSLCTTGE